MPDRHEPLPLLTHRVAFHEIDIAWIHRVRSEEFPTETVPGSANSRHTWLGAWVAFNLRFDVTIEFRAALAALALFPLVMASPAQADDDRQRSPRAQVGPRPAYLVDQMSAGPLKDQLQSCLDDDFRSSDWSIGHRGAALQFPEHTKESYEAAAVMGAGILECDVTFTSDGELVCRHAQCDLHTTTNILDTPLASKCDQPFQPATFDANGDLVTPATARCCASDLTVTEFQSLCGKMDAANPRATTVQEYLDGTAKWRTDLYSTCGTVLTHAESITLFAGLGRKFTPELKGGDPSDIAAVFGSQAAYAQAMIDDYKDAGIRPNQVWAQSFNLDDVEYWIHNEPAFGRQAVYLDGGAIPRANPEAFLDDLIARGVKIVAPPMPQLVTESNGVIVPSDYGLAARDRDIDVISWTTERSGRIIEEGGGFYYQTTLGALSNDGDILTTIDVLAQDVGIIGLFSDWPATTTFYANCANLFPNERRNRRGRRGNRDDDDDDDDDDRDDD